MAIKRKAPLNSPMTHKRRKDVVKPVDEVVFDNAAREDFITGFHRRKMERTRHAQEKTAKKERAQKIRARRLMREERAQNIERHTQAVNEAMAQIERSRQGENVWSESEEGDWEGIAEPQKVDHEDEYADEDRHTVVTIQEVDPSRQGLRQIAHGSDRESGTDIDTTEGEDDVDTEPVTVGARVDVSGKPEKEKTYGSKKKRSNFRYESRAERMLKKSKERSGKWSKNKGRTARKS